MSYSTNVVSPDHLCISVTFGRQPHECTVTCMCWWDWLGLHNKLLVDTVKKLAVENNLCYVKLFEQLFLLFLTEKNKMVKFLHATLWVTVVHHCHPMKAPEKKITWKHFCLYHTWKTGISICSSLENSVIFFMIKPYHWHWFLTYIYRH